MTNGNGHHHHPFPIICCACGAVDALTPAAKVWREPAGWKRIPVKHWPAGFTSKPLVIRVCPSCMKRTVPKVRIQEIDALLDVLPKLEYDRSV